MSFWLTTRKGEKKFSCDNSFIIDHLFMKNAAQILPEVNVLFNDYATCIFDDEWWVDANVPFAGY